MRDDFLEVLYLTYPMLERREVAMKWTGKGKYPPEQERERKRAQEEERSARRHRLYMQAVKDKLDLWGEDSLDLEEKELVRLFHDFFYLEEG